MLCSVLNHILKPNVRSRFGGDLGHQNEQLHSHLEDTQEERRLEHQQSTKVMASESESMQEGLLADYARLTEENVGLKNEMEGFDSKRDRMVSEIETSRREAEWVRLRCDGRVRKRSRQKGR